jgi:hypothetical protein
MGVRFGGAQIVNGNELDVVALPFVSGSQDQTPNPTETVNPNPNRHVFFLRSSGLFA